MIAIKTYSSKLKGWRVEMPNAPYSNRWQQCRKIENEKKTEHRNDNLDWNFDSILRPILSCFN